MKKTFYSVQKNTSEAGDKLFTEFTAPRGLRFRVMNKSVFDKALENADKKTRAALTKKDRNKKSWEAA